MVLFAPLFEDHHKRGLFLLLPLGLVLGGCSEEPAPAPRAEARLAVGLGFTLRVSESFEPAPGSGRGGVLSFRYGDNMPWEPTFAAARSSFGEAVEDQRSFAVQRAMKIPRATVTNVASHAPVVIDGLDGFETIAKGVHETGADLRVYQVMLFDKDSYILMQGRVGEQLAREWEPEFRAMARSLLRARR